MNTTILIGTIIVNLALISYSIAVFKQRKAKALNKNVMTFLTLGIILDITATIFMIIGSSKGGFTLHGFIGYSSLTGMLLDTYFSYKFVKKNGIGTSVPSKFTRNTTFVYLYWVSAYITGAMLVMIR